MKAATSPRRLADGGRIAVVDAQGSIQHLPRTRAALTSLLRPGDLVVVNDARTLPASLPATLARSGANVEVRLAARRSLEWTAVRSWHAVLFGEGDWRTPTELRPLPPPVREGDGLVVGHLPVRVDAAEGRLVGLTFEASDMEVWPVLLRLGRPVQYAYLSRDLAPWDVQTPLAGPAVAVEAPSAGFALDWELLARFEAAGVDVAALTHAAGLSSTGDDALDARLPLPEPYEIPAVTAARIARTRALGGRIVAWGTTVARALESAASHDGVVRAERAFATLRLGQEAPLRVVDALVTGVHERGTSHHALLGALGHGPLEALPDELEAHGYLAHEFGDTCFVARRGEALALAS